MIAYKNENQESPGSTIQLVQFQLGREYFAVGVEQVREIVKRGKITRVPNMPNFVEGVMNLRGQITTIIDLRRRFDIDYQQADSAQSRIIVAEIGDVQLGIIVDSVQDVIRVASKSLSPPPKTMASDVDSRFLEGICKMPESLILLIDLLKISGYEEIKEAEQITNAIDGTMEARS
jgi:purine-binding chemotaxis protein CheW